MKDPKRLLQGGATPLERLLLDASAKERPSARVTARMRRRLGLGSGIVAGAWVTQAAATTWVKAGLLAVASTVVVGTSSSPAPQATPPAVAVAPSPAQPVASKASESSAAPAADPTPPTDEPPAPEARAAEEAVAAPVIAQRRPAPPAMGNTVADLRAETRLLDAARRAIGAGEPEQALQALRRYERRFPRGVLRPEHAVLTMQASKARGDQKRADAIASGLLQEDPDSPYAERALRIKETSKKSAP